MNEDLFLTGQQFRRGEMRGGRGRGGVGSREGVKCVRDVRVWRVGRVGALKHV